MTHQNDATNIAQALQFAASHLSNYGRPENKRLIVLLSDGADWHPKSDDATGEMLGTALEDPVSLMEQLHRAMNIHLHAIGISNEDLFEEYCHRTNSENAPGFAPNHALLTELLHVGGGDAARIGDASVLDDYFRGLGAGVVQQIRIMESHVATAPISEAERAKILARVQSAPKTVNGRTSEQPELLELCKNVKLLYRDCNTKARMVAGFVLWGGDWTTTEKHFEYIERPVSDQHSFGTFSRDLYNLIDELLPTEIRQWKPGKALVPEVKLQITQYLHNSETIKQISTLRNKLGAHGAATQSSLENLAEAFQYFLRVKHIAESDSDSWIRLKKAILERTIEVLREIDTRLETFNKVETIEVLDDNKSIQSDSFEITAEW